MFSQKSLLLSPEDIDEDEHEYHTYDRPTRRESRWSLSTWWQIAAVVLVVLITNSVTASIFSTQRESSPHKFEEPTPPQGYAKLEPYIELDTQYRPIHWNTEYSQKNRTASDAHWDAILPSHGFIAMDREEIKQQGWPESMYLPSDKAKGVYLFEAYHHLHCLRILRKTFWEAVDGRPYTMHPNAHIDHCFDTLRQSVMCYADATPLYTFGDFTAGDGQLHKCKNWDQLREFATKNTACYVDGREDDKLKDHFGVCDKGDDYLKLGTAIPRNH